MTANPLRKGFKQMIAEANAVIETIDVQHALKLVNDPNVQFVDIRDGAEVANTGVVPGAVHASRGLLEFLADPESPMHKKELSSGRKLVLYCASGGRSRPGARQEPCVQGDQRRGDQACALPVELSPCIGARSLKWN